MEYQELELGIAKKLTSAESKTKRRINWQLIGNGCIALWAFCVSIGWMYNYYQVQMLHWHLNATHLRVRELEMWQKHMCNIRHYNCPQLENDSPSYTDDWDWDNFPSMDDYSYDDPFNDNYERNKRDVVAETIDGVPINAQPYADVKRNDATRRRKVTATTRKFEAAPVTQPGFHSPAWPSSQKAELKLYEDLDGKHFTTVTSKTIQSRASRVMVTEDESTEDETPTSNKNNKPIMTKVKSLDGSRNYHHQNQQSDEIISFPQNSRESRGRQRSSFRRIAEDFEETPPQTVQTILKPTRRTIPAAHFSGDTSKYVLGFHTNYKGNGHMKHLDKRYVDWVASDWMKNMNVDDTFEFQNGILTVHESGLYFVYAQIYYLDEHDMNGYRVYKDEETILQCTTMTHSTSRVVKGNTCYTAGVEYLSAGDKVTIRDLSDGRYSLFEKGKSFFGVLKLSDMRIK